MTPMLPLCPFHSMFMPINPGMIEIPRPMVPIMPIPVVPYMYPPNNINTCSSITITDEYDSHMYGRFRHVKQDPFRYRHIPFDWYQPPKYQHYVVHEDAAIVTFDGPVPIGDFHRYYIYGEDVDDYDSTSYESDEYDHIGEPSNRERNIGFQQQNRTMDDFDDEDEVDTTLPSNQHFTRTNNSNYRTTIPSYNRIRPSNYQRNRTLANDDDFNDAASDNSTYK